MKSIITFYGVNPNNMASITEFPLTPEKLFQVDSLEDFLASKDGEGNFIYKLPLTNNPLDIQFFKPELKKTLKIPFDQYASWPTTSFANGLIKYVKITRENDTSHILYYFVIKCEWISQSGIMLDLMMDVLNTFKGTYSFNDKTTVIREHVNRFVGTAGAQISYPIIDTVNEEINPVLWGHKGIELKHKNLNNSKNWNLVYRNRDNPTPDNYDNPVVCYLVPDENTTIKIPSITQARGRITPDMLDNNTIYCIRNDEFASWDYIYNSNENRVIPVNVIYVSGTPVSGSKYTLLFYKRNNKIIYFAWRYFLLGNASFMQSTGDITDYLYFNNTTTLNYKICNNNAFELGTAHLGCNTTYSPEAPSLDLSSETFTFNLQDSTGEVSIAGINEWDKSDPKIIKIIKCPYCPEDFTIVNGVIQCTNDYSYTTIETHNALRLNNLNHKFASTLKMDNNKNPITNVLLTFKGTGNAYVDKSNKFKDYPLDPKIYSSEFYLPKFTYDSFTLGLMLENVDMATWSTNYGSGITELNEIKFYVTSTINSRFAFDFTEYGALESRKENDYPSFIIASRNNEVTLYNVPYINYIKSGYNYDIKNKNQANFMSWFSVGVGTLATAGTTASAIFTGGLSVPMAITTGASTVMALTNAISSTIKNERSIAEKLDQLKIQSASVIGSDDLDILERYNENKLWQYEYYPTDEVKNLVLKMFHYMGYKRKKMGIPNTTSRYWFNYIKCEPVLNINDETYLYGEYLDELVKIMRYGYTIIHKGKLSNVDYWDFKQEYNNIETAL